MAKDMKNQTPSYETKEDKLYTYEELRTLVPQSLASRDLYAALALHAYIGQGMAMHTACVYAREVAIELDKKMQS